MTGALVILLAMLVVGFLLYITDVKYFRHHHSGSSSDTQQTGGKEGEQDHNQPEICCGQHLMQLQKCQDLLVTKIK